jgi:hypothetical protein
MSTTRRTVLRAGGLLAAAALAGCLARAPIADGGGGPGPGPGPGSGPGDGDDGDGSGGTRPTGTGGPGLLLVAVDDDPGLPVAPAVAVTRDTATADHPPRIRVTLTNERDAPVTVGEGRAAWFQYVVDESGDLILLPDGDWPAAADCWRLTDGVAVTEEYQTRTLAPGGAHAVDVDLYGLPGPDACLPVGEFRFETTVSAAEGEGIPDGEAGESARWGFSVTLE